MLPLLAAVTAVALAVQLAALWGMGRRRPVYDEREYLERGSAEDPYAPRFFLRPPLLAWLAQLCHRRGGGASGEEGLRLLMALASVLTVVLTAAAAWQLGGPAPALLAALLLIAQPERILLGCHLWPDTLLAVVLAALAVMLTLPAKPVLALAAGGIATVGVLTRIDFAAALPLLLAAWGDGTPSGVAATGLVALPLLALVVLSLRNGRRYGIPLPDNTWAFNFVMLGSEGLPRHEHRAGIRKEVLDNLEMWSGLTPSEASRRGLATLAEALRSPWRLGRGIVRRLLTMVGPDTFVRQMLLPAGEAYPDLGDRPRRWWGAVSRGAFPLLVTVTLLAAVVGRRIPGAFAWPALGPLAMAVLFHARTRYRVVVMPALSLFAAQEIPRLWETLSGRPLAAAAVLAGGLLLFTALLRIRCSTEK